MNGDRVEEYRRLKRAKIRIVEGSGIVEEERGGACCQAPEE